MTNNNARYIGPDGRMRKGYLMVLQKMGEQADGKIHMVLGKDEDVFHIEDGDEFFTAVFPVDPFKQEP